MRILRLIGSMFLVTASPALASGASAAWIVSQKSGEVRVFHPGMQPASLEVSASLEPGDVIATGPTGRAMLTRGSDYVVVAPGSRLLLPAEARDSGFTQLVQQLGTMLYKVHHTGLPHFAVQTPMLAAVVKGTSFTVIVDQDRAAVQVTDGIVEVSSAVGQAHRLVERGTTVYVGRERPDSIVELKHGALDLPSSKSQTVKVSGSADVPLSAVADLTGGLVHAGVPSPVVLAKGADASMSPSVATLVVTAARPTSTTPTVGATAAPATGSAPTSVAQPAAGTVQSVATAVTQPAAGTAQTTAPAASLPAVSVLQAPAPAITPVINAVATAAPTVTQPVINTVATAVPAIVQPVINTVAATVPAITQPVVNVVQTALPAVTQPVINTVTAAVPGITQPVVNIVQTALPAVTQPVINTVTAAVPAITQPVINVVQTAVPAVTQPVINTVTAVAPVITQPVAPILGAIGGLLGHH